MAGADRADALRRRLAAGPPIVADGGTGTRLFARTGRRLFERVPPDEDGFLRHVGSLERDLLEVHAEFAHAGAEVLTANTFGAPAALAPADRPWCKDLGVVSTLPWSLDVEAWIAVGLGPLAGDPDGARWRDVYRAVVDAVAGDAELFAIETMTRLADADAALAATRETFVRVPAAVTFAIDADGIGYGGLTVREIAAWARDAKPDAVGFNCGVGPAPLLEAGRRLRDLVDVPLVLRPAASAPGHPESTPRAFAEFAREAISLGTRVIGGCCGAGPDHIRALVDAIRLR